jgi:serine/threonine-protein kinase RsbW
MSVAATWKSAFPATLNGVADALRWLEALASAQGFPEDMSYGIQLCVEELFTNVVRHGGGVWEEAATSAVNMTIGVTRADDAVTLVLEDNGKPFDTGAAPAKTVQGDLASVQPGGLGIKLIREFSSGLSYSHEGGINRTTLKFLWPHSALSLQ